MNPSTCARCAFALTLALLVIHSPAVRAAEPSTPSGPAAPGLLFYLSADKGTTADIAATGTAEPTFSAEVTPITYGAKGAALQCGNTQRLAWRAPGNIYAQRGTLAFFWRSRDPVGPTEFPVFRVGYSDHSSWDMVWLRIDYNGHGFDAFVTDTGLARTRVSVALPEFPKPAEWVHLALAWDETRGVRFFVNGKLAAANETKAVYDAGLDQFGPHSRVISPHQVQSDYNFVRGGDIDEVRIYDRMLEDGAVAALARGDASAPTLATQAARNLTDARWRDEWWWRNGWNRPDDAPPYLDAPSTTVRKVEIHDTFDLKRWWWKANDGIRETTWPGVYNRSRLAGRNDYFQLPDWDCYSTSGRAVTFTMPDEPWNQIELTGPAFGSATVDSAAGTFGDAARSSHLKLFDRPAGQEKTFYRLRDAITGKRITFRNTEQETPIEEFEALNVTAGAAPTGSETLSFGLAEVAPEGESLAPLASFIDGRFPADERAMLVAQRDGATPRNAGRRSHNVAGSLPHVHVLVPNSWDEASGGLDGIAIDLPALDVKPTHGGLFPMNIRVKDPLWPARDTLDFSFSVKPGEARTLWLDLRDRILPAGKSLYLTIAGAGGDFSDKSLKGAKLRLVFKPREAARAEHEIDRFTQARDAYAMLVEEHPNSAKYALWVRFRGDLEDLLRVNPEHEPGRKYAAVAWNAPRPPFAQPEPPAGVPLWAFRQTELLGRVKRFVTWYIDNRQIENGELGGGLSDDTDLTNTWVGVALMGCEPDKISSSVSRVLDATYANGMFTRGLPTIQADELHSYEEGINCLAQAMILSYGSPRQLERAFENIRGVESITGVNSAGHRHIRSSYYSGTRIAEDAPWNRAKPYSYLVLQPALLLADYNGNPDVKKWMLELCDGLLAHRHPDATGRGGLPGSIDFATDAEGSASRSWLPWPMFWSAWQWTGDKRYLDPIFDGGTGGFAAVNANALDILDARRNWGPRLFGGESPRPTESRAGENARPPDRVRAARDSVISHIAWQLSGDTKHLATLYGHQIEDCSLLEFINTEGSLRIDRVGVPTNELQRARLGGVALLRNATLPGHAVSWRFEPPANDQSVAILIPDATPAKFTVMVYNLAATPVTATMTGWNIEPGVWEIAQGIDTVGDHAIHQLSARGEMAFERSRAVRLTFPARVTTIVTMKLKTPGTAYTSRPDLGIDRSDVVMRDGALHVTVHSLGSVAAPATKLTVRKTDGTIVATTAVPSLAAPLDLQPKTVVLTIALPSGSVNGGGIVEIDSEHAMEEITTINNTTWFAVQ